MALIRPIPSSDDVTYKNVGRCYISLASGRDFGYICLYPSISNPSTLKITNPGNAYTAYIFDGTRHTVTVEANTTTEFDLTSYGTVLNIEIRNTDNNYNVGFTSIIFE